MTSRKPLLAPFLLLFVFSLASCSSAQSSLEKAVSILETEIAKDYEAAYKVRFPDRARNGHHCKFQIVDIRMSSSNPDVAQVGVDRWGEDDFGQRVHMSQSLALYDAEHIHMWRLTNGKWQPVTSGPDHLYGGECIYDRPWRKGK